MSLFTISKTYIIIYNSIRILNYNYKKYYKELIYEK